MYFCLEKNICPWRHSNCWLPNSFILGGGTHSKFRNAGKMQFFSFARVEWNFQMRILSFSPSIYIYIICFKKSSKWLGIVSSQALRHKVAESWGKLRRIQSGPRSNGDWRHVMGDFRGHTMWGPRSIAKLVQITPITMVYCAYNYSIRGVYKPTFYWGGPHCTIGMSFMPIMAAIVLEWCITVYIPVGSCWVFLLAVFFFGVVFEMNIYENVPSDYMNSAKYCSSWVFNFVLETSLRVESV